MSWQRLVLILCLVSVTSVARAQDVTQYLGELKRLSSEDDFLGTRALLRKLAQVKLTMEEFRQVREVLHGRRVFGQDLVLAWDGISPQGKNMTEVDKLLLQAGVDMSKRRFEEAFTGYQEAAQLMKRAGAPDEDPSNTELYLMTLHRMGQSLFGAGRFADALQVYEWFPPTYSNYRHVLFERMWSAFRAGKIAEAVGALASQHSSYFGVYVEPEAYLVQIYIYRKLCRRNDLMRVMANVSRFKKAIASDKYTFEMWLASDFQTKPFLRILAQTTQPSSEIVGNAEREAEREQIKAQLTERYNKDKKRLTQELERVVAFSKLAFASSTNELPRVAKLPPNDELSKSGREMWPVSDGEDWLDELGGHTFIGASQCGASRKR